MRIRDWSSDVCSSDLDELDRRRTADGGEQGEMVGHAGDDRPACGGTRRGCADDARGRALHALSEARIYARLPRRGAVSGWNDRLYAEIGSATWWERVWQDVSCSGVAGTEKKKK